MSGPCRSLLRRSVLVGCLGLALPLYANAQTTNFGTRTPTDQEFAEALGANPLGRSRNLRVGPAPDPCTAKASLQLQFDFNSDRLNEQELPKLAALGRAIQGDQLRDAQFQLAGHTDSIGTAEYNRKLSERRAAAVKSYLVSQGVSPERLEAKGFGFDQPLVAPNPAAPENRRVEVGRLCR